MTKKPKKNYFDNDAVTEAILAYQKSLKEGRNDVHLIYPYTTQIQQLIRGVINTHKIYRFWPDVDELVQEAFTAIMTAIRRYKPGSGTAFNYLSIVAKQHLKNWTVTRNKKRALMSEFNDEIYLDEATEAPAESFKDLLEDLPIPPHLEATFEAIVEAIEQHQIHSKRDIVRQLTLRGDFDAALIQETFEILEEIFNE